MKDKLEWLEKAVDAISVGMYTRGEVLLDSDSKFAKRMDARARREAVEVLADFVYVAVELLPVSVLAKWAQIQSEAKKPQNGKQALVRIDGSGNDLSFLSKEITKVILQRIDSKGDDEDYVKLSAETKALSLAISLAKIPYELRQSLVQNFAEVKLPNLEFSKRLLDLHQSSLKTHGRSFGGVTISESAIPYLVAELAYKLAIKDRRSKVSHIHCRGEISESMALAAGNHAFTVFESDRIRQSNYERAMLKVGLGERVEIRDTSEIKDSESAYETYDVGFFADLTEIEFSGVRFPQFEDSEQDPDWNEMFSMRRNITGRLVCLLPQSWLLKTSGKIAEYKRNLISIGRLEAVFQLPKQALSGAPSATALVVINMEKKSGLVQFVDASFAFERKSTRSAMHLSDMTALVDALGDQNESENWAYSDVDEITDNDFNLDPKRYIVSQQQRDTQKVFLQKSQYGNDLESLVKIIRCQSIRGAKTYNGEDKQEKVKRFGEIVPANIDRFGRISVDDQKGFRSVFLSDKKEVSRAKKQMVRKGDILFSVKGGLGKCAMVSKDFKKTIGHQSFVILRVENPDELPPVVLLRYLMSPMIRGYIDNRKAAGTTMQTLKMGDVRKIPVPKFSAEEIRKIVKDQEKLDGLIGSLDSIEAQIDQAMSALWHSESALGG